MRRCDISHWHQTLVSVCYATDQTLTVINSLCFCVACNGWWFYLFIYLFWRGGGVLTFKPLLQYIKTFFRWFKPVYLDRGLFIWSIPIHSDRRLHVNCQTPEVALSGPEDKPAFLKLPMSQFNWALTICGKHGSFHGRHSGIGLMIMSQLASCFGSIKVTYTILIGWF